MALAGSALRGHQNLRPCNQLVHRSFSSRSAPMAAFTRRPLRSHASARRGAVCVRGADLKALVFDCDGVIVESEDLHRQAYNAAYSHFNITTPDGKPVEWSEEYYDDLQNRVGGGKNKMRDYFVNFGWPPSSTLVPSTPETEEEQSALIDALQEWKSLAYQDLIGSGKVHPRPGIIRLMDEARDAGLKLAICSAATKSSVIFVVEQLLGVDRYRALDAFMAGDDVPKKKPDPSIYSIAAERMQVNPEDCLVVEDSTIGMKAALGAGMRCIITYTSSTRSEAFEGAERIYGDIPDEITLGQLRTPPADGEVPDDRR